MTSAVDLTKGGGPDAGGAAVVPPQAVPGAGAAAAPAAGPGTEAAKPAPTVVPRWRDPALRLGGFLLALALAAVTAAYEVIYAPLYWNTTRVPVSILAAVVLNLGLVWFTTTVTGRRIAVAGPALVWVVVMVAAASRTSEGDLMLTDGNWVGIGTMLAGSVAFGAGAYRLILTGVRPHGRPAAPGRSDGGRSDGGHPGSGRSGSGRSGSGHPGSGHPGSGRSGSGHPGSGPAAPGSPLGR